MAVSLDSGALRYERFFQTSGDLLCALDPAGRFVRANEAFLELLERKGWLLPRDVLKTTLILERAGGRTR